MRSKVPVTVPVKTENVSSEGQRGLIEGDFVLPEVSSKDKKGGKLTKSMKPLLDKAIESALQLEKYLPREFTTNNMVENQAASKRVQSKMTAIEREMKRHKDADTFIGIQIALDYRVIYEAAKKAAEDDASLIPLRDQLGAPFKKPTLSDEKKAEKKEKKAAKAA